MNRIIINIDSVLTFSFPSLAPKKVDLKIEEMCRTTVRGVRKCLSHGEIGSECFSEIGKL